MSCIKLLTVCLILLYALGSALSSQAQPNLAALVFEAKKSLVQIQVYSDSTTLLRTGVGFMINDSGAVVTHWQLLQGALRSVLRTPDGMTYKVRSVVSDDQEHEIIGLLPERPPDSIYPLTLSDTLPEVGTPVVVLGGLADLSVMTQNGVVAAMLSPPEYGNVLQLANVDLNTLNGSPIFDSQGKVVGLAAYKIINNQALHLAIPNVRLRQFLQRKGLLPANVNTPALEEVPFTASELYQAGLEKFDRGAFEEALKDFQIAVRRNTNFVDAYFQIGRCQSRLQRYDLAVEAYNKVIELCPNDFDAFFNKANALKKAEKYDSATVAYQQAIQLDSSSTEAYCDLAFTLINLKRYQEALYACQKAIQLQPDNANAYFNLANCYWVLRQDEQAIAAYREVVRYNPEDAEVYARIAKIYKEKAKTDSAIVYFQKAVNCNRDFLASYNSLGLLFFTQQRYQDALGPFEEVVRLAPVDSTAHFNLGAAYYYAGEIARALQEYNILRGINLATAQRLYDLIYPRHLLPPANQPNPKP